MRPRLITAENAEAVAWHETGPIASMRPRLITAENEVSLKMHDAQASELQ